MSDYWESTVKEAFEDAKITATKEQIDTVISWVVGSFENYDLGTGRDCIPNPAESEIKRLEDHILEIKKDNEKAGFDYDDRENDLKEENRRLRIKLEDANSE